MWFIENKKALTLGKGGYILHRNLRFQIHCPDSKTEDFLRLSLTITFCPVTGCIYRLEKSTITLGSARLRNPLRTSAIVTVTELAFIPKLSICTLSSPIEPAKYFVHPQYSNYFKKQSPIFLSGSTIATRMKVCYQSARLRTPERN